MKIKKNIVKNNKKSDKEAINQADDNLPEAHPNHNVELLYPPPLHKIDIRSGVGIMSLKDAEKLKKLYAQQKKQRLPNEVDLQNRTQDDQTVSSDDESDTSDAQKPSKIPPEEFVDEEAINNHLEKLKVQLPDNMKSVPWIETLDYTLDESVCEKEKIGVNEDIKRETRFAEMTLKGVEVCLTRLKKMNIPFNRPSDYYADMLRTDYQMNKIKAHLIDEAEKIKLLEKRKQQKFQKKFAKEVRANKLKEQMINKAKHLEKIEMLKKNSNKKKTNNFKKTNTSKRPQKKV